MQMMEEKTFNLNPKSFKGVTYWRQLSSPPEAWLPICMAPCSSWLLGALGSTLVSHEKGQQTENLTVGPTLVPCRTLLFL